MARKFLNGVQSYFNDTNYTLLGYDSLDVVGGDLILKRAGTEKLRIGADIATFTGNVESQDTFILNYNNAGNKWQQLFDGANGWNLRYNNGSSWSSNYINVNTSGNVTFAGRILNSYSGTSSHTLQNSTSNGTILNLTSTGDSRTLTLQSDHIFSNGSFYLGNNSYQTNFRGSSYNFETGNATFAGVLKGPDGSASAPAYSFSGRTDTGMYAADHGSYDRIWFTVDGTNRFYIDANGANVVGNLYLNSGNSVRNYSGVWAGTTGTAGNGFYFLNTANGNTTKAMDLSSGGNVTFAGSTTSTKVNINQAADEQGLEIKGYDDHSSSDIKLQINGSGHARLSQTTDGGSGYLFLQAENYLQLIAGTFIYTQNTVRIYDNAELQLGSSGDYKISHKTSGDKLIIHTDDNKGITIDNAGNVTLTENTIFKPKHYAATDDLNNDTRTIFSTHSVNNATSNRPINYSSVYTLGGSTGNALQISTNEDYSESGMWIRQYNQNNASPQGTGWQNWAEVHTTNSFTVANVLNSNVTDFVSKANGGTFSGTLGVAGSSAVSTSALTIKSQSVSSQESAINIIQNGTGTNPIIRMGEKSTDGGRFHMFDGGVEKIAFYTDGTDNHISAGNLGIGTASPGQKLDVRDGTITSRDSGNVNYAELDRFAGLTLKGNGAGAKYISTPNTDDLGFKTNNVERMRIDSSGDVGVGSIPHTAGNTWRTFYTGSSATIISRQAASGTDAIFSNNFYINSSNVDKRITTGGASRLFINEDVIRFQRSGSDSADTTISWSESMRIDSSGNVGIGTTDPNYMLHLGGSTVGAVNGQLAFGDVANVPSGLIQGYRVDGSYKGELRFLTSTSGGTVTQRMVIDEDGNVGIGTATPAQKLQVVGTQIRLDNNSGSGGGYYLYDGSGNFRAALWDNGTNTRLFADGQGSTAAITIDSNNATFAGIVSVLTGKAFRMYNAAGTGWGELSLEETANKIQFNRGIQPSGDNQSDQLLGTSSKRWHQVHAGSFYGDGSNLSDILPKSIYLATTTTGFLIKTNIVANNYAMLTATIDLEQFNVSSKQKIELSATVLNNGTVQSSKGTADSSVTVKLFVYNSVWYIHVPTPSTYVTISAYVGTHNSYQGQANTKNEIAEITNAAVPSSGVTGSTDIVCKFSQGDIAIPGVTTFESNVNISTGNHLFFDGGNNGTYISEDIADRLRIFVGGQEFLRLTESTSDSINIYKDTTFSGKVFVNQGSDLTTQALQVNGFIDITDVTSTALRWYNGSTFRGGLGLDSWAHGGSDSDITMYISGDNSFHVSTNNVKRLEIDSSGATFAGHITLASDKKVNFGASSYIEGATSGTKLMLRSSDDMIFQPGSSTKVTFQANGNVGVAESSPLAKFEVAGSIKATNRDVSHTSEAGLTMAYDTSNAIGLIETWTSKPLMVRTYNYQSYDISGTERLRINSSGISVSGTATINGPILTFEGSGDQTNSADSATVPSTTTEEYQRISYPSTYTDGRYTHEWAKIDRGGNLPLYLRQSKGTANSFTNLARFGDHSNSIHEFEVFGSIKATHFYGDGSNLTGITASNADTVDSLHAGSFLRSDAADTGTGQITLADNNTADSPLILGSSNQSTYTLQQWRTSAHGENNAYILAYGASHGTEAGNFAIKNTLSGKSIFFEVNNAVPLRLENGTSTVTGNLTVTGDLNITGDINSTSVTNLDVDDKTITIAKGAADSNAADGAGIVIDGAAASLLYDHTGTQWEFNKPVEVKVGSSAITFTEYNNGATIWLDGSNGDFVGGDYFNISAYGTTQLAFGYGATTKMHMDNVGNVTANSFVGDSYGASYSVDSTSGTTAIIDTVTLTANDDHAAYEVIAVANPNAGGSSKYRDYIFGKIIITTGYSGSAVTRYIHYMQESAFPRTLHGSGGGALTMEAVFWNGSSETEEFTSGSGTPIIRVKIDGYNSSHSGANTSVRLKRIM